MSAIEAKAKAREDQISRTSGQDALDNAIAAADLYIKAANSAKFDADKVRLKKKCNEIILLAERLKKIALLGDSVSQVEKRLKVPCIARQIPTSEKIILLRNSKLHGSTFPPWEADPHPDEFAGDPFSDTSDFPLSDRQLAFFAGWKRPSDLVGNGQDVGTCKVEPRLMEPQDDYDLIQDVTTDCSVVASLCASMKNLRPGPASLLSALMFPTDSETGQPKVSANGRYVFRMYFNGCFRKVVIDDRLPSSSTSRALYVVDRQNSRLIWPALLEKAYLKVRGGYDFPGSNSGTDLWVLTGWVPQQLFLQSDEIEFGRTWSRVKKAFDYGDVVVTLGTGHLSMAEEETLGLVGEHDYAVLDMSESSGSRRMLVKNPWCDGLVWKGVGSSDTPERATDDHPKKLKPGSFWISFDDVLQNFESLYLNWNPALFTERQDHHFTWELPQTSMAASFAYNPQYSMAAAASGSTWILLNRHFQDDELEIAKSRSTTLSATSNKLGFMSLYIFDNKGERVQLSDKSIYRGPFVDSPQTLAPFEAKRGVKYTIVVVQQALPLPKYSFTMSFFSRCALDVRPAEHNIKSYTEIQGSWTGRTAGGNAASPTYLQNPQFAITVPTPGPLSILLSTDKENLAVHVDLVWAGGRRVTAVTVRDLVSTSGEYRRGCALAQVPSVDAGTYTVVCSTFEPGQLADFTLRVGSMVPCKISVVPPDGAGRLRTQLPTLVFGHSEQKKRAALTLSRLTRATIVLMRKHTASAPGTPRSHPTVRLGVELGRGPDKGVLAATGEGEFKEVGMGLRTAEFDVDPRMAQNRGLWIVVEQIGSGPYMAATDEGLSIEVLSETPIHVGPWETVDS
ncbi:PALB protein [Pseudomassariella vexata]|uniref:PALB protein n=1 Tax=Pseudomassariella vexata TaxID=1141098 RepID=A0A1Y2EEV8_9PEZI|nr:PALB protein [Pseudomassariella vexata]ORY69806.1 PALB protein [Pseudomassariella vexata]